MIGRFRELDGLRGIAALVVLVGHFTGTYNSLYRNDPLPFFDFPYGAFGVQLFFLISGFVILMSARRAATPGSFAVSRAARIYPAYWISLILALLVMRLWRSSELQLGLWESILNFTMFQRWLLVPNAVDVSWTLAVELQFYLLIFGLLVFTRCRISDRVISIVVCCWLVVAIAVSVWAGPFSRGVAPDQVVTPVKVVLNLTLAEYGPLFCAGMVSFLARSRGRISPLLLITSAGAVLVSVLLHSWQYGAIVGGICVFFILISLRRSTRWLTVAPLQWLGKISYSLYIIHTVIGYVVIKALLPYVGRDWGMLVATGASLVAAWLLYELGEKRASALMKRVLEWSRESYTNRFSPKVPLIR